jgi:hypothetical protein
VDRLLLAALDRSGEDRMRRYREATEEARTVQEMVEVAKRIYREDVEGGHITAISELIGGSLAHPELGPELVRRMEPWIDFVEEQIRKVLPDSPLFALAPPRDLAFGLVAFYLGLNLVTRMDESGRARIDALFAMAANIAPLAEPFLAGPPPTSGPGLPSADGGAAPTN